MNMFVLIDSSLFYVVVIGALVMLASIMILVYGMRRLLPAPQAKSHHRQTPAETLRQALLQTQLEIQDQTLKNISREIHENIGQVLSLAKLTIGTISTSEPETQEKANNSRELIGTAIRDLRNLGRSLHADYIADAGLMRSIEYELELARRSGGLQTDLQVEGTAQPLPQEQELILFRIVQKALYNIVKYARATTVSVKIQWKPDLFILELTDNGIGFDEGRADAGDQESASGILDLHGRARMINTNFVISKQHGTGVTMTLQLPIIQPKNPTAYAFK